ncbi:MAG: TraB/GumN family protein [Pontixanthobacter sp.]
MQLSNSSIRSAAIALALCFVSTACASLPSAPPATVAEPTTTEPASTGPALWKVADDDTTIYLFGTVHVLPKETVWYEGKIATALQSADSLVTEIYIAPDMQAAAGAAFMTKGTLPEGESLRDLLTDDQKASYEASMAKMGMPAATFDRFEPWLAAVNISMIPLLKAGYSPESGVEKVLETEAATKSRGELESVELQVDLFDGLPMDSQIAFMLDAAANADQVVPMLDTLIGEWAAGDAEELGKLMNDGFADPVLAQTLLYNRNRNWAEWIDTRLDTPGTIFIAVGAGHLAGKDSVQDALAARGIASTRIQ